MHNRIKASVQIKQTGYDIIHLFSTYWSLCVESNCCFYISVRFMIFQRNVKYFTNLQIFVFNFLTFNICLNYFKI